MLSRKDPTDREPVVTDSFIRFCFNERPGTPQSMVLDQKEIEWNSKLAALKRKELEASAADSRSGV